MELSELFHKLIDGIAWSSQDNADEAHAAVDEHLAPQKAPAPPEGTK